MRVVRVEAGALTAADFAPFGWLPVPDTDPGDGMHTLVFEWGDAHLNVIAHEADEVERPAEGVLRCTRMYRHATHTQALMPLDVSAVVAVAPADTAFTEPADAARIRAFRLDPLDVFVLHRAIWHWGPYPLGPDPVRLLNVQGRRYLEDNAAVDVPEAIGAVVEVTVK
jgi:ureidoglycolate hydrolase